MAILILVGMGYWAQDPETLDKKNQTQDLILPEGKMASKFIQLISIKK